VPWAKENMHTTSDLPIDYKELEKFTEQITKEFGIKFDFSHFNIFKELGLDTWHF
jgi:hypothetical protein